MEYRFQQYKYITLIMLILILAFNFLIVLVDDNVVKITFYIINLLLTVICSSMLNQKIFVFSSKKSKLYYIFVILNFFLLLYAFDKNPNKPLLVSLLFLVQGMSVLLFINYNFRDHKMILNEKELNKNQDNPIISILIVSWIVITLVQKWDISIAFTLVAINLILIIAIDIKKIKWNQKQLIIFIFYLLIPVLANSILIFTNGEIYTLLGIALLIVGLWFGSQLFDYKSTGETDELPN